METQEQEVIKTTDQTVAEQVQEQQSYPPEVQAAMYLHGALPLFRRQLELVSGVQAKRVLSALIESPLEKETPGFTTKEAEDLFIMGLNITNAKFILFTTGLKDQKIAAETEEAAKVAGADAAVEQKGEEVNG